MDMIIGNGDREKKSVCRDEFKKRKREMTAMLFFFCHNFEIKLLMRLGKHACNNDNTTKTTQSYSIRKV